MIINFGFPLQIWKSWIYISITTFTMFFVLLPSAVLVYLHFQSSIIPEATLPMVLQFQYMKDTGPFAFYNLTDSAYEQVRPWKSANTNTFTKIEQVLTIHMKYLKLTPGSTVGGVRVSIYNDKKPPVLHKPFVKSSSGPETGGQLVRSWPFKAISMTDTQNEFSLYRTDRRFKSWSEVVGKSYSKSVPFMSGVEPQALGIEYNKLGILDYFVPKWVLNFFVPQGIQNLLSIKNLSSVLRRNESHEDFYDNLKYLETLDLLSSYGSFQDFPSNSFSTGVVLFDGELNHEELVGTSLLVELDMNDVFVVDAYVKLDYVLCGFRWWVYWWPGLCFLIGVTIIWVVSCLGCLLFSWFAMTVWGIYGWLTETQEERDNEAVKRNLSELLKE